MIVTLIDHMGSDLSVVNAARVSFEKTSEWDYIRTSGGDVVEVLPDRDAKLIRYLAKHNHWTPFGHCFASFRIKAPIFVARQLGKHQVGLVWNEVSRRYVDSEPEFYVPDEWRLRAANVKQGSSEKVFEGTPYYTRTNVKSFSPKSLMALAVRMYDSLLEHGICPEQARMILPQATYTEWVWSGSLAAFARVCKLRLDPHTQKETRQVAEMIDAEMSRLFPISWQELMENDPV